jgi:PKD repeat protein/biopolymer transport protein ExbD
VIVVSLLAVASAFGVSGADTITTIAGTGVAGSAGDGGQATSAQLNRPRGIAIDAQGNVYIADENANRVRKLSGGIISTVAGTGTAGFSGDGGQATSAQLKGPIGVAVDAQGNLYIGDLGNQRVRKVSGGIISTVAGTGTAGYSGDGGQATSAQINSPYGVAVDAQGNLYIADFGNQRIRKVSGGIISTVAGTGTAGATGDGGQATSAQLKNPIGVSVDAQGNLYIADLGNYRVRKVSGGIISTVAGTGTLGFSGDGGQATSAQLNAPADVAADAQGTLYIADWSNNRIRKVSGGIINTIAGTGAAGFTGDGGQAASAQLNNPYNFGIDGQGNLYVSDTLNQRVRKIENKPPTASFTFSPASGTAPLAVSFDGSASADPDGSVAAYAWDFGDGGTANTAKASHTYAAAGTFNAKLTVTDDSGASASTTKTVTVSAAAPPPPPPTKPTATKLKATKLAVGKAAAGKAFAVSLTVKNATTGKGIKGKLTCTAKLAGKPLPASGRSSTTAGKASCGWKLPTTAHGKRFTGTITGTYAGVKLSRSFSVTVP